ncbi:unnamed protein product [Caenorhabditis angaria]|uniref:B box-type domain-containing protein n=1 Tax=Caenorhabditis angaria TaxID=860376 RepID=A0A9P1IAF3_9PELO|nr:unnamed protein product [Caenorhabditis angaria]
MEDDDVPINCFNCTLEISNILHMKCAECPVSICVLCFQFAAESDKHKRGHNYEIIDPEKSNAACGEWGFMEESRLLKSVHQFKMGNWGEIVRSLGEDARKAKYAKEYFDKVFIRGWMGQFAIKNSDWDHIKYEMKRKGQLKDVLKSSNSSESVERLLMIRDALVDKNQHIDKDDPRIMSKVQSILESYVDKCLDGKIEIFWENPNVQASQFETEIVSDDCDPSEEPEIKVKKPKIEADSDSETNKKADDDEEDFYDNYETAAEESDGDEKTPVSTPKTNGCSSTGRKRKKNKISFWNTKKFRRLNAYKHKMNRDTKKSEKELAALSTICPVDEVKELRNAFPTLSLENNSTGKQKCRRPIEKDLSMLGYNVDREEFEHEWFNEAEQLISRLTITPAPAEKDQWLDIENDIKFARVQNYIRVLGIRKAKRNAILEHEKIQKFFEFVREVSIGKRRASEIVNLIETVNEADFLTKRISKLQDLQRSGDTSLKHVPPEVHRKKKIRKTDHEKNKRGKLEWAKYARWHQNTVQDMD